MIEVRDYRTLIGVLILLFAIVLLIIPFFYSGTSYQLVLFGIGFVIFALQFSSFFF